MKSFKQFLAEIGKSKGPYLARGQRFGRGPNLGQIYGSHHLRPDAAKAWADADKKNREEKEKAFQKSKKEADAKQTPEDKAFWAKLRQQNLERTKK